MLTLVLLLENDLGQNLTGNILISACVADFKFRPLLHHFAKLFARDVGAVAIGAALQRAKVEPGEVSEVILGQILTAAQGQNPARQAAMKAKISVETPSYVVNQLCGSGLRAVALGYQAIRNGDAS